MTLTPHEAALIGGAMVTFTVVFTRVMSSRCYVMRKECQVFRSGCQLHAITHVTTSIQHDLKEIGRGRKTQQLLMRILMERQGISLGEQLKIEKLAEGDIHELRRELRRKRCEIEAEMRIRKEVLPLHDASGKPSLL